MPASRLTDISTVLCDLDGVVWLAHQPIPGSVEAIATVRASGRRVLFVTNNSAALMREHEAALAAIGIDATGDVVSSSSAAALMIEPGQRVLVTGGPGVIEAVEQRGATAVHNIGDPVSGSFDVAVVGMDRDFGYDRLRNAGRAVLDGARLIGTNGDTTYPTPLGLEPGGGSLVAAVATVGGVDAVIAGKPEQPMADAVLALIDAGGSNVVMVGDRPETDGLFAARLGARFALVESGVTRPGDSARGVTVDARVDDLAGVVALLD